MIELSETPLVLQEREAGRVNTRTQKDQLQLSTIKTRPDRLDTHICSGTWAYRIEHATHIVRPFLIATRATAVVRIVRPTKGEKVYARQETVRNGKGSKGNRRLSKGYLHFVQETTYTPLPPEKMPQRDSAVHRSFLHSLLLHSHSVLHIRDGVQEKSKCRNRVGIAGLTRCI